MKQLNNKYITIIHCNGYLTPMVHFRMKKINSKGESKQQSILAVYWPVIFYLKLSFLSLEALYRLHKSMCTQTGKKPEYKNLIQLLWPVASKFIWAFYWCTIWLNIQYASLNLITRSHNAHLRYRQDLLLLSLQKCKNRMI